MKDASRAALIRLTQALRRFEREKSPQALEAFLVSDGYQAAFVALSPRDRLSLMRTQAAVMRACGDILDPLPPRWSMRVRWTPARIAALKRAARRHGDDFEAIARRMGIPEENARRAYYRYVKVESATAA